MTRKRIYLIGSLRNPQVPLVADWLRTQGFDVFDDWFAAGPKADDHWMAYEQARGHGLVEALEGEAARNVFAFDKRHLERADYAVLMLPAGKSGHLELGWFLGQGKPGFVLLDGEPERFDVMYQFATSVHTTQESLRDALFKHVQDEFYHHYFDTLMHDLIKREEDIIFGRRT